MASKGLRKRVLATQIADSEPVVKKSRLQLMVDAIVIVADQTASLSESCRVLLRGGSEPKKIKQGVNVAKTELMTSPKTLGDLQVAVTEAATTLVTETQDTACKKESLAKAQQGVLAAVIARRRILDAAQIDIADAKVSTRKEERSKIEKEVVEAEGRQQAVAGAFMDAQIALSDLEQEYSKATEVSADIVPALERFQQHRISPPPTPLAVPVVRAADDALSKQVLKATSTTTKVGYTGGA